MQPDLERQPVVAAVGEVDENGNPRVVVRGAVLRRVRGDAFAYQRATHIPRLRVLAIVDETAGLRHRTWRANPYCCQCDGKLQTPDAGGVITTAGGLRMACRETCFADAMLVREPARAIAVALGRRPSTRSL